MKGPGKALVTVATVGALAALVVVTKPGPEPVGARRSGVGVASSRSTGADPSPARPHRSASAEPAASASAVGPTAGSTAFVEHGRHAVLRTDAGTGSSRIGLLPVAAPPRWAAPEALKFFSLKKHYRGFRKRGKFEPAVVGALSGAAVKMTGAFMPIDPLPDDGRVGRFWLANPVVVMAGSVFCTPPPLADLVYVTTSQGPIEVDREKLFRGVLILELLGRLRIGPQVTSDGVEYLFGMELRQRLD